MLYDFMCPACGKLQEEFFKMDDKKELSCPECGMDMDRIWTANFSIQGDTCSDSVDYTGYDETLGVHLTGKAHRREEMKKQGLTEYTPDPDLKHHRKEIRYIKEHSQPGDPAARAAISKEGKAASDKRRSKIVKKYLSQVKI